MATNSPNPTLGEFIQEEARRRRMSLREFAKFASLTHGAVSKYANHGIETTYGGRPIGYPEVEFLIQLSIATGIEGGLLFAMVAPETTSANLQAALLANRIVQLPPDKMDMFMQMVNSVVREDFKKIK